ncbi:unnamed protein product [Prunus armeniaca]
MEKSWMLADRRSKEYEEGVEEFLRIALANAIDHGCIRCPCQKCGNTRNFTIRVIREHMYFNGLDQTYKDWIWHAKPIEINASEIVNQEPQQERDFLVKRLTSAKVHKNTLLKIQRNLRSFWRKPGSLFILGVISTPSYQDWLSCTILKQGGRW